MKKILISPYTYIGLVFIIFIVVAISNTYAWFNWQSTDDLRFEVKIGNVNPPVFDGMVNRPNIVDGMIPIKYNNTLSRWEKADSTNKNNDWYDYNNKKWANIVLVNDSSRASYISAPVGTEITEETILAYYVWIPRYRYQLWNASNTNQNSNEQEIKIEFESTITPPSCGGYARNENGYDCTGGLSMYDIKDDTSNYLTLGASRMYSSATNGTWLTHPAFRFGEKELDGIWVGKFETTGNITTPTIKPNEPSLRSQTVSSLFSTTSKFKTQTNYGVSTSDIDSHMMKNIEWGAVAYLTNSQYGRCTSGICTEISINNSLGYYTGRSGGGPGGSNSTYIAHFGTGGTQLYNTAGYYTYDDKKITCAGTCTFNSAISNYTISETKEVGKGTGASTTGNIYGIYDLSGGAYDYVMGNMAESSTNYSSHTMYPSSSGTSFIASNNITYTNTTLPKKYYDIYNNDASSYTTHNRGLIGDATKETLKNYGNTSGGWYGDYALFPYSTNSWFDRGDNFNCVANAGSFAFVSNGGIGSSIYASRSVLCR